MAQRLAEKKVALEPLRVLPRGLALVQDYRALQDTATSRFHGWTWDGKLGPDFVDPTDGQTKNHGGRVKKVDEVVVIAADDPHRTEYLKHLRDGDLWAADEASARASGVTFEPDFGGEHPGLAAKSAPAPTRAPVPASTQQATTAAGK
jgi:hypothetical protein